MYTQVTSPRFAECVRIIKLHYFWGEQTPVM